MDENTASDNLADARARAKVLAKEFIDKGEPTGWFEQFYRDAAGDHEKVSWADLEPNAYFRQWAETHELRGDGRSALVVGCGLGDDARYLYDLGFKVTAFDISPTAIEWARKLHKDTEIKFETADLFAAPAEWELAFDFVLEVYTIQPLPLDMRPGVIDAIAGFLAENGQLVVVTRGRENDEVPEELPWALSRDDLSRFQTNGLVQQQFLVMDGDEDPPIPRFVTTYSRTSDVVIP